MYYDGLVYCEYSLARVEQHVQHSRPHRLVVVGGDTFPRQNYKYIQMPVFIYTLLTGHSDCTRGRTVREHLAMSRRAK